MVWWRVVWLLVLTAHGVGAAPSAVQSGPWSSPLTWEGGVLPVAGAFVVIPQGQTVTYDLPTSPVYAQVQVQGRLAWDTTRTTELNVGLLLVQGGRLEIGLEATPFPPDVMATIRLKEVPGAPYTHLHGQPDLAPALHTHGGLVALYGAPKRAWTLLAADAPIGATTLTLAEPPDGWRVGDHLVLSGTHPQGTPQPEEVVVAALSGATVTLAAPLQVAHLGTAPRQAAVGNLTRNIVVTSADPTGKRGHVMFAHGFVVPDSAPLPPLTDGTLHVHAYVSHVEFAHLGRPVPGMYPVHFHRLGNEGRTSYLAGASVHHGANLCVRVHTTNFLSVEGNVCYDTLGHGYVTEDGTEMDNTFTHNLAVRTRATPTTNPNDPSDTGQGSGFWLNNPRNALVGNYASDADGWGYQVNPITIGTANTRVGKLVGEPPVPVTSLPLGTFTGNRSQGNGQGGLEVINLDTPAPTLVQSFTALDAKGNGLAGFATGLRLEQFHTNRPVTFYVPGNQFPIIKLSRQPVHQFVGSRLEYPFHTGYQFHGTLLFQDTAMPLLDKNGNGVPTLAVVTGQPRAAAYQVLINTDVIPGTTTKVMTFPKDSTIQQELYLFDADGPGQHLKLIPGGVRAADALTYRPARVTQGQGLCSSQAVWSCYQEAAFTGPATEGPPLRLPVFINTGALPFARILNQAVITTGQDVVDTKGNRWMADSLYLASPPGYRLPRYGYRHATLVNLGSPATLYGTLAGAHREAYSTGYVPMEYVVDVPNGPYQVDLHFVETWNSGGYPFTGGAHPTWGAGQRRFDVLAQGVPALRQLDVFREAGGLSKPLVKSLLVQVTTGQLVLAWSENGMVSALAVCPPSLVVNGRCQTPTGP